MNNARSLRIAVVINCQQTGVPNEENVFTGPRMLPAGFDVRGKCGFGIGQPSLDTAMWASIETFQRAVAETGGIPSATGYLTPVELVYFNLGGMNYLEPNPANISRAFQSASTNALILAQQIGAYGGYNAAGNGSWGAPCPRCPIPFGPSAFTAPGFWTAARGGRPIDGKFNMIVTPVYGDSLPGLAGIPPTMTDPFFVGCQLSKSCIVIAQYAGTRQLKWHTHPHSS
jgi:hypothetical protein